VGNATGDPAAVGSPFAKHCPGFQPGLPPPPLKPEDKSTERCKMHVLGFADAVQPITEFLVAAAYGGGAGRA